MEIIHLTPENEANAVAVASRTLAQGGIVLFPTDTLYGLAVDALNTDALERLRELKGREKKKPISVIVPSVGEIKRYAEVSPQAQELAERFLPGALTLVLPSTLNLPEDLMLNGEIGIRVPNDAFALALAQSFGRPYTATSANRAGYPTLATPELILAEFGAKESYIDVLVDAGERSGGVPSTVVSVTGDEVKILREGTISREALGI
jgi:L-threonylcarbamoyladenylate synthase